MKETKNWLAKMRDQMTQLGLDDPDKKPDNEPCGECGMPIIHLWVDSKQYSYWHKGNCWNCREKASEKASEARRVRIIEKAGVPLALQSSGLKLSSLYTDDSNKHALTMMTDWTPPGWMMLTGPIGTGKTAWLTALFNSVITQGKGWGDSKWVTEADMFNRCDAAHQHSGYTARQGIMQKYLDAPILLIDDLGASRRPLTEWQGGTMRNLFDKRHSSESPTFMTTNIVKIGDLERRYGDHIVSRILHATGGLVYLGGPDRRKT